MRIPFLRLLLVGGGAAVLATAGFAYMASNGIAASSLGEGQAAVTGYSVSNISYTATDAFHAVSNSGCDTGCAPSYVTGLSFTLTSDATTAPANGAPTTIAVALLDSSGKTIGYVYSSNGNCSIPQSGAGAWSIDGDGNGSGTVTCNAIANPPLVADVSTLDVEANQ